MCTGRTHVSCTSRHASGSSSSCGSSGSSHTSITRHTRRSSSTCASSWTSWTCSERTGTTRVACVSTHEIIERNVLDFTSRFKQIESWFVCQKRIHVRCGVDSRAVLIHREITTIQYHQHVVHQRNVFTSVFHRTVLVHTVLKRFHTVDNFSEELHLVHKRSVLGKPHTTALGQGWHLKVQITSFIRFVGGGTTDAVGKLGNAVASGINYVSIVCTQCHKLSIWDQCKRPCSRTSSWTSGSSGSC